MISNEDYHADPAISASHLKLIQQSPYHYWARFINPDRKPIEPSAAMKLGSLVHTAVLEPEELGKRYARCGSRTTKAGKEVAADLERRGIEAVTDSDWNLAIAMNNSVRSHPIAAELLSEGQAEQSFWWVDDEVDLRCKCRPDWLNGSTIVDLKTCIDASPASFAKSVVNFGYHIQAAHYLHGLPECDRFVFIAVEKSPPFAVAVYELDANAMKLGDHFRECGMKMIAACQATKSWPGYADNAIQLLSLPSWANYIKTESF